MTESQLKTKVMQYIKEYYPHYWIYKTNDRFTSGIPDLLLCADRGHLIAIELKIGNNKPTRIQQYTIDRINAAGGTASVCRSVSDVKKILDTMR